jgi:hypothetical protein
LSGLTALALGKEQRLPKADNKLSAKLFRLKMKLIDLTNSLPRTATLNYL